MWEAKLKHWYWQLANKRQANAATDFSQAQKKMLAKFQQWQQDRVVVHVELPEMPPRRQSFVLAVEQSAKRLVIDELFPKVPIASELVGQAFTVSVRDAGIEYRFKAPCLAVNTYEKLPACWLAMPQQWVQLQRRGAYRWQLPSQLSMQVALHLPTETLSADLQDISVLGVGLQLAGDWRVPLQDLKVVQAHINLPQVMVADISLAVQRIAYFSAEDVTILGATFVDLSIATRNQLAKKLMQQQRLSLQAEAGNQVA